MAGPKFTRTELKLRAQADIAHMVSLVFNHVNESGVMEEIPASQRDEFWEILEKQADRAARLMGFEQHWKS